MRVQIKKKKTPAPISQELVNSRNIEARINNIMNKQKHLLALSGPFAFSVFLVAASEAFCWKRK